MLFSTDIPLLHTSLVTLLSVPQREIYCYGNTSLNKIFFFPHFQIQADLTATGETVVIIAGIAFGVSLAMTIALRFLAFVLVWTMYLGSGFMAILGTGFMWYEWHIQSVKLAEIPAEDQLQDDIDNVNNWMYFAIAVTVFTGPFLLLLLFLRSRIALVVQLFREASNTVARIPFILIQPLWTTILILASVVIIGLGVMYVFSAGAYPVLDPHTGYVEIHYKQEWIVSTET